MRSYQWTGTRSVEDGLEKAIVHRGRTVIAVSLELEAGTTGIEVALAAGGCRNLDSGLRNTRFEEGGCDRATLEGPVRELRGIAVCRGLLSCVDRSIHTFIVLI